MAHEVLILGGGFGGLTAARRLERKLPPQAAKVTLVNDVNFMLYTLPLGEKSAGGTDASEARRDELVGRAGARLDD